MAQQHDLFDDIIDISKGIDVLKDPLGGVTDALLGTAGVGEPQQEWNPADYKERPRFNAIPCLACKSEKSTCRKCAEVCPVNAIDIDDGEVDISDACRKCGLCVPVCPTEAMLSPKVQPKKLYDAVAAAAAAVAAEGGIPYASALALSLGIALQNFPEGMVVSFPLYREGKCKAKAFLQGVLSGIVEPLGAIVAFIFVGTLTSLLPIFLSFAAGAMFYVVVEELIPEASEGSHSNIGTIGAAVGFAAMMMLDGIFG